MSAFPIRDGLYEYPFGRLQLLRRAQCVRAGEQRRGRRAARGGAGGPAGEFQPNSREGGGQADAAGDAWVGGTLKIDVAWGAGTLVSFPDLHTARVTIESVDLSGNTTGLLTTEDLFIPPPVVRKLAVKSITKTPIPNPGGVGNSPNNLVAIATNPPLVAFTAIEPAALMILVATPPTGKPLMERFVVRPAASGPNPTDPVVAIVTAGPSSAVAVNPAFTAAQLTAYMVFGIHFPLFDQGSVAGVPIAQTSARGQVTARSAIANPFDPNEQIVDPNTGLTRDEPTSPPVVFAGQQWLPTPTPQTLPPRTPVKIVHHQYFDPADYFRNSRKTLPFTTPTVNGLLGYRLERAPLASLCLADVKRRGALTDGTAGSRSRFLR